MVRRGTARAMGVDKGPLVTVAAPLASEEDVQRIYNWIDEIPLSRPKRCFSRALFSRALGGILRWRNEFCFVAETRYCGFQTLAF